MGGENSTFKGSEVRFAAPEELVEVILEKNRGNVAFLRRIKGVDLSGNQALLTVGCGRKEARGKVRVATTGRWALPGRTKVWLRRWELRWLGTVARHKALRAKARNWKGKDLKGSKTRAERLRQLVKG